MNNRLFSSLFFLLGVGACGAAESPADSGGQGARSGATGNAGSSSGAGGGATKGNGGASSTAGAAAGGAGNTSVGGNSSLAGATNQGGTGEVSAGGAAVGGSSAMGGAAVGGSSAVAGAGTGGNKGTAGSAGAGSAGAGGGSSAGAAGWLTGYTATMFGDHTQNDCAGVSMFSDTTQISQANCTYEGVTIAQYSANTANDASYYGAPGDLSSIWSGPECKCQGTTTENAQGMCPSPPSCPMEANCGKCFEIKCDPNGTGVYSNGDTRKGASYCNANQAVVIEVIDACPHNHPSNTWWCTTHRENHIDISCSAMEGIAGTPADVGSWGWLNVQVRPVDCSVGLGVKAL